MFSVFFHTVASEPLPIMDWATCSSKHCKCSRTDQVSPASDSSREPVASRCKHSFLAAKGNQAP